MHKPTRQPPSTADRDSVAKALSRSWRRLRWRARRRFGGVDRDIIDGYLRDNTVRKLHIGCGDHLLDGWLNADLFPRSPQILHLDSTQRFPFGDEAFDYVFSEHMIEHIPYPQGLAMLSECHRILKRGGTIRISTPGLPFLIDLYRANGSDLHRAYVKWATEQFVGFAPSSHPTFVINNFVRDWGHQFIYDEEILSGAMRQAGFTGIGRYELNESGDESLRNLENEQRMPPGFLRLETMTLQARKGPG